LRAGVSHQLRAAARASVRAAGRPEHLVVVFSNWRTDPVAALLDQVAHAVNDAIVGSKPLPSVRSSELITGLSEWTEWLGCWLLVVLDQFEEYFLYHPDPGASDFEVQLPAAIRRPGLRANFLISLREDTLAQLDRFKGRIPSLFDNYLRLE